MNRNRIHRTIGVTTILFAMLATSLGFLPGFAAKVNGSSWTNRSAFLQAVTYGNGTFVAVGESGTILTSGDGRRWAKQSSGTDKALYAATYGNGTFVVVVGANGTILTSRDGKAWARREAGTSEFLTAATYGNGTFVAVGDYGTVLTSRDGRVWAGGSFEARWFAP